MTCRVFGPPLRTEGGIGHCELCYHWASEEQITACELVTGTEKLESELAAEFGNEQTIVAYCLIS